MSALVLLGLGNPGPDYSATRHNLGRECLEVLAERLATPINRRRWKSKVGKTTFEGRDLWLVEPETYMNLSGRAAAEAVRDLGAETEIWVVYDELDLPLGRLRIRESGSAAGHNGIRSLIAALGTDRFVRFRVGIGRPAKAGAAVDRVLGRFSKREAVALPSLTGAVADALQLALRDGVKAAMDRYNQVNSLGCEEIL